jgi:DHA1 family bicyclomycin/chloramphenicol resistance-like MFS transporter
MLLAARLLPETAEPTGAISARSLADDYRRLLGSRAFLGYAVGGGCATTSMYAFIAAAPFIFAEDLHQPPHAVGVYLAVLIVGVSIGSILATRLVRLVAIERLMVGANLVSVLGASIFLASVLLGSASVASVVGSMILFTLGAGMASPAALTKAVSVDPAIVGSAAGFYGFMQMAIGALCASIAGLGAEPALAAAAVLVGAGIVAQAAFFIALRRERSARQP